VGSELKERDLIRCSIQIEYDLANENYYIGFTITFMNQLCINFRCQIVRIVFKLNTHRDEITRDMRSDLLLSSFLLASLELSDTQVYEP